MELSWGKPLVEFAITADGTFTTTPANIKSFFNIKENTSKLKSTPGDTKEAKGEGGEIIDSMQLANTYSFELQIYLKKGQTKPIDDTDGIISDKYSVRLTPYDSAVEGWQMDKCSVKIEDEWDAENGTMVKYVFTGLVPKTGKILKSYKKSS